MVTTGPTRNADDPTPWARARWTAGATMIPVGLLLALTGVVLDAYWVIVGGMTFAAWGAYEITRR